MAATPVAQTGSLPYRGLSIRPCSENSTFCRLPVGGYSRLPTCATEESSGDTAFRTVSCVQKRCGASLPTALQIFVVRARSCNMSRTNGGKSNVDRANGKF